MRPWIESSALVLLLSGPWGCGRELGAGGTLTGRAHLIGRLDHAGISVSVEGSSITAVTDALGQYRLGGVPNGSHTVVFAHAGYQPEVLENVVVLGGETVLRPVTLGRGRAVGTGAGWLLLDASRSGAQILFQNATTGTVLWDATQNRALTVTATRMAVDARLSAAGDYVAYRDAATDELVLWQTNATETVLATGCPRFVLSSDGTQVIFFHEFATGASVGGLSRFAPSDGVRRSIDGAAYAGIAPVVSADGTLVLFAHHPVVQDPAVYDLSLWDARDGVTTLVATAGRLFDASFTQDAAFGLVSVGNAAGDSRALSLWDLSQHTATEVLTSASFVSFTWRADGRAFCAVDHHQPSGGLYLWERATGNIIAVTGERFMNECAFLSTGDVLGLTYFDYGSYPYCRLQRFAALDGDATLIHERDCGSNHVTSPDGAVVYLVDWYGHELFRYDAATGVTRSLNVFVASTWLAVATNDDRVLMGSPTLSLWATEGATARLLALVDDNPTDLAVTGDGTHAVFLSQISYPSRVGVLTAWDMTFGEAETLATDVSGFVVREGAWVGYVVDHASWPERQANGGYVVPLVEP